MAAIKIDKEIAIPNLDVARLEFDLTQSQQAVETVESARKERREAQRHEEKLGILRLQHLARETAKTDETVEFGSFHHFDRDLVSPWVRVKDDDPRLAVEIRTAQNCPESSVNKPINIGNKPRSARIEAHIIDKETGQELKPETIYRTEGYKIEQSVDDIRGQIHIIPGLQEWIELNEILGQLESHFGVTPLDAKSISARSLL